MTWRQDGGWPPHEEEAAEGFSSSFFRRDDAGNQGVMPEYAEGGTV